LSSSRSQAPQNPIVLGLGLESSIIIPTALITEPLAVGQGLLAVQANAVTGNRRVDALAVSQRRLARGLFQLLGSISYVHWVNLLGVACQALRR
jgi:hypothetical protein